MFRRLRLLLEMIKFEHTLFALPFALMAALVAMDGRIQWGPLGWILLAMVGARSSAMAFNRLADLEYDRRNPRTRGRALPAGLVTVGQAWAFTLAAAALLVAAAWQLNPLALWLSPVALAVVWGYSLTKRFTAASHLVLGLALGIAPSAAWIALTGTLTLAPMALTLAVLCWVAGFDIIYACQDAEFDRAVGLHSLPAALGLGRALALSAFLHLLAFLGLAAFGWLAGLGWGYAAALAPVGALLIAQHRMVRPDDLRRVDAAFFTANGAISLLLLLGTGIDVLLAGR
ncbi:MAG TPA: UbiA-like polyprenyltransferase [Armatimonadota bacterium]|nr:UbiA-like polyprenyltransferase [Armatimonadota bacterium]